MNSLLYGHNPEERVIAVNQLNDQTIRLFKRVEGKVLHKDVEFFPFFFLADDSLIKEFPKKFWLKELEGNNYYRFIAAFSRWSEMWEAVHYILRQYNKSHSPRVSSYQELKEILVRTDAVRQFLMQSGITLFKGMEFNELVRLHIDVQCAPAVKKKQRGKVLEEQILAIALVTSTGKEYVFNTIRLNERAVLEQCIKRINNIDPDVIEGYNLFGTILPALIRACERQQIPLAIGRDGSDLRTSSGYSTAGFGEGEWFSFDAFGRHLVDILTVVEAEIDVKRIEQSLSLFSLAKHFNISFDTEHVIPNHQIIEEWNRAPKNVADQCLRSTCIVRDLSNLLSPPLFVLTQMCPFNYRMLVHISAASRVESLLLREYVRQKRSVPKPSEGSRNVNMPAEIFHTGVFPDVLYIELDGLYSSILVHQSIKPKTDELNVFLPLLIYISDIKRELLEQANIHQTRQKHFTAQLNALKRLLDSFHVYLGSAKGLYSDVEQAEAVLTASREILKEIMRQIELFNATIIQSDGRGFFLITPDNIIGEVNQNNFLERLSNTLTEGIHLALSHRYKKMFSYRRGNHALLDLNNNILTKGNSIISRGMERYLRVFTQRFIECLMTNDLKRLHHAYATVYTQVIEHKWTPLDFCRTEIVRMDIETYQQEVADGRMTPSPAMEAAVRSSVFVKSNTKISFYITGSEADVQIARFSRLAEEWNPHLPDENTAYYLTRIQETINKFREFFEPTAFERIFSLNEMFGFSDEGIRILTRKVAPEALGTKVETDDYGIWLAELE